MASYFSRILNAVPITGEAPEEPGNDDVPVDVRSLDDLANDVIKGQNWVVYWQAEKAKAEMRLEEAEKALQEARDELTARLLTLGIKSPFK